MPHLVRISSLAFAFVIGCGGANLRVESESPSAPASPLRVSELALDEADLEALGSFCAPERDERCDGVDTNCDGRIDEGCEGAVEGLLVFVASWVGEEEISLGFEGGDGVTVVEHRALLGGEGVSIARLAFVDGPEGEYRVRIERSGGLSDEATHVSFASSAAGESAPVHVLHVPPGETRHPVSFRISR